MQQPLEPGQILNGKYKIVSLIGEGGMARVWLAEESAFGNRRVAIKEPKPTLDAELRADMQRRFQQELEVNAALESVNARQVVRTYTVESVGDSRYLVMAYMAGGDLDARIHAHKDGLPVETVIAVAQSILTALQTAHQHPWEDRPPRRQTGQHPFRRGGQRLPGRLWPGAVNEQQQPQPLDGQSTPWHADLHGPRTDQ